MIIDFHTHAFPEKIASKAIEKLSFLSGGLQNYTDGTVEGIKQNMKKSGVSKSVVLSIATNATQQDNVNNFAKAIECDEIISFGSVFPTAPDALEQLDKIKELGLKGVKLHPDYQGFFVDDEKMKPIYKKISDLGLDIALRNVYNIQVLEFRVRISYRGIAQLVERRSPKP